MVKKYNKEQVWVSYFFHRKIHSNLVFLVYIENRKGVHEKKYMKKSKRKKKKLLGDFETNEIFIYCWKITMGSLKLDAHEQVWGY